MCFNDKLNCKFSRSTFQYARISVRPFACMCFLLDFALFSCVIAAFRRPKMLDFTKYTHKLIGSYAWIISQNYDLKSMSESGTGTTNCAADIRISFWRSVKICMPFTKMDCDMLLGCRGRQIK